MDIIPLNSIFLRYKNQTTFGMSKRQMWFFENRTKNYPKNQSKCITSLNSICNIVLRDKFKLCYLLLVEIIIDDKSDQKYNEQSQ